MAIPSRPKRSLENAVSSKRTNGGTSAAEVVDVATGLAVVANDNEAPSDVRVRAALLVTELQAASSNQARRDEVMNRALALVGQNI